MEFVKIDRDTLAGMKDILSQSAGYAVTIEDELEYFDRANAGSWMLAKDVEGKNVAFVRQFSQGDWSFGELYIAQEISDRKEVAQRLLAEFQKHVSFEKGHRLRFDVLKSDRVLNEILIESGFSQKREEFLHFDFCLKAVSENVAFIDKLKNLNPIDVKNVFEHLHPVSVEEVSRWIGNGSIRAAFAGSELAAVAQVYESDDAIEINRIATHSRFLRQGHARKLIGDIFAEARARFKQRVYLKVDLEKTPAISLYRNMGFKEQPEKAQCWHSRWY